ncbi:MULTISPECIES: hypothetical protein [Rhizobium]|uniref:Uncharacterized protein n=1 Tax=Rhizobium sophoriradicis TaxID=1535245 RepID=A0A2A5KPB2_9HYPH|nr:MULTISPECIES: hypothetical protein [Rhizobium]AJC78972.1 hypothetical protein IE4803_CH01757 [Rhizobium etli bv. phaseoli str. IE4803]ARQ57949.1 hypothetical protein Kim5_CH01876 [Rhizobium sp. Kim5]PCK78884.1 hypothetical protein CPT34_22820 [Rhizobium sophoriradicis]RSC20402.1 hypothetical protein EFR00_02350 [Rhizobium sophoriradicis]
MKTKTFAVYSEEKSTGFAVPLIAILLAIAGILAVLVATGGDSSAGARVWVPQAQQQGAGQ